MNWVDLETAKSWPEGTPFVFRWKITPHAKWNHSTHSVNGNPHQFNKQNWIDDSIGEFARLDAPPSDDAELATVEWLEANGVTSYRKSESRVAHNSPIIGAGEKVEISITSIDSDYWRTILISPTRAQVRHLLAALTPAIEKEG